MGRGRLHLALYKASTKAESDRDLLSETNARDLFHCRLVTRKLVLIVPVTSVTSERVMQDGLAIVKATTTVTKLTSMCTR